MDIFIVALNGSPNKGGNTAFLLQEALDECRKAGAETELIFCREVLNEQKNPFCVDCSSPCLSKCISGTNAEKNYQILARADGIIAGSPVYFGTVSAQLKAFFDKTRFLRTGKKLLNVAGGAVTTGKSRFGGQETTIRAIHDMFLVQGMIIVGDGYFEDDCGHFGSSAQSPSWEDLNAINRSRILARRIVQVATATQSLRNRS